jgi:hypothetical protein
MVFSDIVSTPAATSQASLQEHPHRAPREKNIAALTISVQKDSTLQRAVDGDVRPTSRPLFPTALSAARARAILPRPLLRHPNPTPILLHKLIQNHPPRSSSTLRPASKLRPRLLQQCRRSGRSPPAARPPASRACSASAAAPPSPRPCRQPRAPPRSTTAASSSGAGSSAPPSSSPPASSRPRPPRGCRSARPPPPPRTPLGEC